MKPNKVYCPNCRTEIKNYKYWYEIPNVPKISFSCPVCLIDCTFTDKYAPKMKTLDVFFEG